MTHTTTAPRAHRLAPQASGWQWVAETLAYPFASVGRAAVVLPVIIGLPHLAEYAPLILDHLRSL